jgi:Holliday junction resolvase RusA-like endonuclease
MPIPQNGRVSYKENGKRKSRKVEIGDYHISKPDIDNLFKGVTDSLNGILWADDSLICEVGRQLKIYGKHPGIEIEVEKVQE